MAHDHAHDACADAHGGACGGDRPRTRGVVAIPMAPLRWAVVGCLGLVAFGMILPFSPIPPCPLLSYTGVPCPFCGMTRSVRALVRFDLADSIRFQPFGMIAGLCAVVILALWALPRTRTMTVVRVPVAVVVVALAASWIWNIGFNPTFA